MRHPIGVCPPYSKSCNNALMSNDTRDRLDELPAVDNYSASEVENTFETLGLLGNRPSAYNYVSAWNNNMPAVLFDVIISTSSRPNVA
jgi:hypothetical protein